MAYSNAHKLAAVVSSWARPAVSQIASEKFAALPMIQGLQSRLIEWGIVTKNYNISSDIAPMVLPVASSLMQPVLENYFSRIPDESIPNVVHEIITAMEEKGEFSILEGVVTFDAADIVALKKLIEDNLPIVETDSYEIIKE